MIRRLVWCMGIGYLLAIVNIAQSATIDPLASWKKGEGKQSIIEFVAAVTDEKSSDYIKPAERIAVFDNDGTLWAEKPLYVQLAFAMDRIKAMAPQHPKWKSMQPFQAVLEGDMEKIAAGGSAYIADIVRLSHSGMTTEEFKVIVEKWIADARHPRFNRPYTDLVYKPMLELLEYLRANKFKTYIVTGGGVEFVRAFAETAYGIPPEQVIGSTILTKWDVRENGPALSRTSSIEFIADKKGKPVAINKFIGRRPVIAFGNSDGDLQMLQWTSARKGRSLSAIIHHTDKKREWKYDSDSKIGHLEQALKKAEKSEWLVVDMKKDWLSVFSFEK